MEKQAGRILIFYLSPISSEMRRFDDSYRLWDQLDDGLTPPPAPAPQQKVKKEQK